jgi:hypothetical protein
MARPIEGIPPFKGKAAKWMTDYLKTARPDAEKVEQARRDQEVAKRVKPLP